MNTRKLTKVSRQTRRSQKTAIVVICVKPNKTWIDFLSKFTKYDVYMIVDDNSTIYKNDKINIIQIPNKVCEEHGFINMTYTMTKKLVTGWEKAIYYFSNMNLKYNHVWFFE